MRTYSLRLVQVAALVFCTASALAQNTSYGAGESRSETSTRERGTVLEMPAPQSNDRNPTAQPTARPDTPPRGMRMNRVRTRYGAPASTHGPVGQPPITRWDYPDYRVYFEYDHVLHAVVPDQFEPLSHTDELQTATP